MNIIEKKQQDKINLEVAKRYFVEEYTHLWKNIDEEQRKWAINLMAHYAEDCVRTAPIHVHKGIKNTLVYIENGAIIVRVYDKDDLEYTFQEGYSCVAIGETAVNEDPE